MLDVTKPSTFIPATGRRRAPSPDDVAIGARILAARSTRGLSQDDIARRIGITGQQMSHYESGRTRIGAARLFAISQVLRVSVGRLVGAPDARSRTDALPARRSKLERRLLKAIDTLKVNRQLGALADLIRLAERLAETR